VSGACRCHDLARDLPGEVVEVIGRDEANLAENKQEARVMRMEISVCGQRIWENTPTMGAISRAML
jgi:hypothetical protein